MAAESHQANERAVYHNRLSSQTIGHHRWSDKQIARDIWLVNQRSKQSGWKMALVQWYGIHGKKRLVIYAFNMGEKHCLCYVFVYGALFASVCWSWFFIWWPWFFIWGFQRCIAYQAGLISRITSIQGMLPHSHSAPIFKWVKAIYWQLKGYTYINSNNDR